MALVQLITDDITGIMVDGFISDVNIIKSVAMNLKCSKTSSWYIRKETSRFLRSLRTNNLSYNSLYHHFGIIKDSIIYENCNLRLNLEEKEFQKTRCWQKAYTIGNNLFSMEGKTKKWLGKINVDEISVILKREYDNIRQTKPNKHYLQNIIIFNNRTDFPCIHKCGCYADWVNKIMFIEKKIDTYIDYPAFYRAWSIILGQNISHYKTIRNKQ